MSESVDSIKFVIEDLHKWANDNRVPERASVANRMDKMLEHLSIVEADLIKLQKLTTALPPELGDIHDLPEDLLAELHVTKTDEFDNQLITVMNSYGGEANLDQILVGLYRKFKVKQKRRVVQNKLYRMEMVWSVAGKKGVYTTTKPEDTEDSNDKAFGGIDGEILF